MHDHFMQDMADISKKEFTELALDGSNYLTWAMDVKINLSARGLVATINPPQENAKAIPEKAGIATYAASHFFTASPPLRSQN
jgi:hypothetical protein